MNIAEIWMSPDRAVAEKAMDVFTAKYSAKYRKEVDCLQKDRTALARLL